MEVGILAGASGVVRMQRTDHRALLGFAVAVTIGVGLLWAQSERAKALALLHAKTEELAQANATAQMRSGGLTASIKPDDWKRRIAKIADAANERSVRITSLSISSSTQLGKDVASFVVTVDASGGYSSVKDWLAEVQAGTNSIALRGVSINQSGSTPTVNVHATFQLAGAV